MDKAEKIIQKYLLYSYNFNGAFHLFWVSNILSLITFDSKAKILLISHNQQFLELLCRPDGTPNMPVRYHVLRENGALISIAEVVAKINKCINAFLCGKLLKWLYYALCFFYSCNFIEVVVIKLLSRGWRRNSNQNIIITIVFL